MVVIKACIRSDLRTSDAGSAYIVRHLRYATMLIVTIYLSGKVRDFTILTIRVQSCSTDNLKELMVII